MRGVDHCGTLFINMFYEVHDTCILFSVAADGSPIVTRPNSAIPDHVVLQLDELIHSGLSVEDAVTYIRGKLVPAGYTPYPFRKNTEESLLDKLRSLVATYTFRNRVRELQDEGVYFTKHLYVPEVDPVTSSVRHDRADHNHLLKRIAHHIRDGGYEAFNYEAFSEVLADPLSGLTHAALVGKQRQSVKDTERLLSYHVADSLQRHGYIEEVNYVRIVAQWHESSDGRGLSQLQRCRFNCQMLNFILEEWMPWYDECYDFSTIDINRYSFFEMLCCLHLLYIGYLSFVKFNGMLGQLCC